MQRLELSVHEFMAIMGHLDEGLGGKRAEPGSLYSEWHNQWTVLDERLEKLQPMERADMLFDGKVTINAITEPQLEQLIGVVQSQVTMHQKLIDNDDEDADSEDLEIWQKRLGELDAAAKSAD